MEKVNNKYNPDDYITLPSGHRVLKKDFDFSFKSSGAATKSDRVVIDKLPSMSGSIAGASSKFLLAVQKHKEKEEARVAELERLAAKEAEAKEFERQRLERKRLFDEEAAKKREKRQRRKSKQSTHGLDLPPEVVQRIREDEKSLITSEARSGSTKPHPLSASSVGAEPHRHSEPLNPIAKASRPVPIRIIEEEDS